MTTTGLLMIIMFLLITNTWFLGLAIHYKNRRD